MRLRSLLLSEFRPAEVLRKAIPLVNEGLLPGYLVFEALLGVVTDTRFILAFDSILGVL
jgi:hypothetical protein